MAKAHRICSIQDCGKVAAAVGLCSGHYHRLKRYGDPAYVPPKVNSGICSVPGCCAPARTMGWCRNHYGRWKRNGDPLAGRTSKGEKEAWLIAHAKYEGEGCLIFPFGQGRYGHVNINGEKQHAHRAMCRLAHGEPPTPELETAHSCGNGHLACVHPGHLRWDTAQGNQADRLAHGTDSRGEKCATAKLTEDQARFIKANKGILSRRVLAAQCNVSVHAVAKIHAGVNWAWL